MIWKSHRREREEAFVFVLVLVVCVYEYVFSFLSCLSPWKQNIHLHGKTYILILPF